MTYSVTIQETIIRTVRVDANNRGMAKIRAKAAIRKLVSGIGLTKATIAVLTCEVAQ